MKKQRSSTEKVMKTVKPRWDAGNRERVEIDKKTKVKNPRKFVKHKGNICAESAFDRYLREEGGAVETYNSRTVWLHALKKLCGDDNWQVNQVGRGVEEGWLTETDDPDENNVPVKKVGEWNGFDGWLFKSIGKVNEASEAKKLFIVLAHSGRSNGSALISASDKKEARQIAKDYWLDAGTVDRVYPAEHEEVSWYLDDMDDWPIVLAKKIKKGVAPFVEIEWGT